MHAGAWSDHLLPCIRHGLPRLTSGKVCRGQLPAPQHIAILSGFPTVQLGAQEMGPWRLEGISPYFPACAPQNTGGKAASFFLFICPQKVRQSSLQPFRRKDLVYSSKHSHSSGKNIPGPPAMAYLSSISPPWIHWGFTQVADLGVQTLHCCLLRDHYQ